MQPLRPTSLLTLLVLLLAAAVVAGGCGGTLDKATYQQKVQAIGPDVSTALTQLSPTGGHQPTADDLRAAGTSLGRAADRLDGLQPPSEVATPHRRMVKGLREMKAAFLRLSDRFGKAHTDDERTKVFLDWTRDRDARTARDDITAAQQGFQQRGYAVFTDAS